MKKRIYFEELKPGLWLVVMLVAFVLILVALLGMMEIVTIEEKTASLFLTAGCLIQGIFFLRIFLYKNYVQYNRKGIMLRLQQNKSLSFRFSEVKNLRREAPHSIRIERDRKEPVTLDLSHVEEADIARLANLLEQRTQ